jgi:S-layer protein (TIGR01567 family)
MKKIGLIAEAGFVFLIAIMISVAAAGNVEVKGMTTNVGVPEFTWDNATFPGFYYDMSKNLGAETITFRLSGATPTGATLSDQPDANYYRGVVYQTMAQLKNFKYKPWGQYDVIGFLGDQYFAAYDPTVTVAVTNAGEYVAFLYDASKNRNVMTNEQISKVLIDNNTEMLINSSSPLKLAEGYELAIKSINVNETKVMLELRKNGQSVDTKIIQPTIDNSKMADQTYYYKASLGNTADIIQIAVHFKNVFHGDNKDSATIDGIFQISDTPMQLKSDQQYGKMSIRNVDATGMTVTMDNKDNQITLSKNKDVLLMQNIHIRTADQDGTAATPLRYYIYSEEPCKC